MSRTKVAVYQKTKAFHFDFSADRISSDGGLLLLKKQIKKLHLVQFMGASIPDFRHPSYVLYSVEHLLSLRVMLLCCGYEDCNDIEYLKHDPALQSLFDGELPGQSTLSRWENSLNLPSMVRLALRMIDYYVESTDPNRKHVVIDVDCTDDPTHGKQQGSLFHGYYWQWMYNELFYLDGETGQVILPVLRPGNVHSSKWNERFLCIIVEKIKARYPHMEIHVRAGRVFFSCLLPLYRRIGDRILRGHGSQFAVAQVDRQRRRRSGGTVCRK